MTRTSEEIADWLGYLTRAELAALKGVCRRLPPDPLVVNIGAGAGTATLAVLEERPDALIFSIDPVCGEDPVNTSEHLRLEEAGLADTGAIIRIWGRSQIVGKRWRWPADLVIVDGDHSAEGIQGDIDTWLPQVKPGGYIVFHDYGDVWPAVREAVDRAFFGQKPCAQADALIAFRVSDQARHHTDCLCGRCHERECRC